VTETKKNNNYKKGIKIIKCIILCSGVTNQLNQSYNSSHHELNSSWRGVAGDLYCIRSVLGKSPWLMYVRADGGDCGLWVMDKGGGW